MGRNTGAVRHTHKYFKLATDGLWHCSLKNCTHFMPKNMPEPVWKDSICWGCEKTFELTPDNMKNDYPTCDNCIPQENEMSDMDSIAEYTERKLREARMLKLRAVPEPDQIEVIESHSPDCDSYTGRECNCK